MEKAFDNSLLAAKHSLTNALATLYNPREAESIARYWVEWVSQCSYSSILLEKRKHFSSEEKQLFEEGAAALLLGRPLQYVTGEAWFANRKFKVCPNVLIPRPETEELVAEVISFMPSENSFVLDVGTGSGCIAITLKAECPQAEVWALDKSPSALEIARQNAFAHGTKVSFIEADILKGIPSSLPEKLDVIVSNPPYVLSSAKSELHPNVVNFEPAIALFVPDDDPLIFYRQITILAKEKLHKGGKIFFEVNEAYGNDVAALLLENGFRHVVVKQDIHNKNRIVSGEL